MPQETKNANTQSHSPSLGFPVELGLLVGAEAEVLSLQPHHPGVLQLLVAVFEADVDVGTLATELVGGSVLELGVGVSDGVVTIGAGDAEGEVIVVVSVMVVGSLQPNQPGDLHDEVVRVLVIVVVGVTGLVVVVPSRQPHQPGVLHVSVRV